MPRPQSRPRALPSTFSRRSFRRKAASKGLPGISVIIPAHNEQATAARTLRAILAQRYPRFEVLLLADNCTDNTVPIAQRIAKKNPRLRVLPNPKRLGLAGSLNRGISFARYPLLCTLHADCIPRERTWLRSLAATLLADPRCGAATTAQLVPRSVFDKLTLSEKLLTVGSVQGSAKPRLPPPGQQLVTVNNKGDLYRRTALKAVGGFGSKRFRVAGEDQDLSLRLRSAGWKLLLAPGLLFHLEGSHSRGSKAFFKKQLQYSEARGAMKRIYGSAFSLGRGNKWKSDAFTLARNFLRTEPTKLVLYALLLTPLWPLAALLILALTAARAWHLRRLLSASELALFFPVRILGDLCNITGFVRGYLTGRQQF